MSEKLDFGHWGCDLKLGASTTRSKSRFKAVATKVALPSAFQYFSL